MRSITSFIYKQGLFLSWAIALIATAGSLYFSEVMLFTPCLWCWYQRIAMYPLVILLGIATVKNDRHISIYVLPISLIGLTMSIYHYLQQKVPFFDNTSGACSIIPCTGQYINWLGFITIPFLAGTAFLVISIIHILIIKSKTHGGLNK